jgi:hypothetical protein
MKAIPTEYDGIKFRSRLEARYAMFFDEHKIGWEYEVEGIDLGGRWYLPDFWLPDSRTYLEVKGPLKERTDLVKLAQDQIDSETGGCAEIDHVLFVVSDERGQMTLGNHPTEKVWWGKCRDCLCWGPEVICAAWTCRCCGFYNGIKTYTAEMEFARLPQMQWQRAA